jgi:hypothetical protein
MSILDLAPAVITKEVTVGDLYVGSVIFHEGRWVKVTNIYWSERFAGESRDIFTTRGVYGTHRVDEKILIQTV